VARREQLDENAWPPRGQTRYPAIGFHKSLHLRDERLDTKLRPCSSEPRDRPGFLDLFAADSWRINVYAGELDVRPPAAPTTNLVLAFHSPANKKQKMW
jgi:hypothetical protein